MPIRAPVPVINSDVAPCGRFARSFSSICSTAVVLYGRCALAPTPVVVQLPLATGHRCSYVRIAATTDSTASTLIKPGTPHGTAPVSASRRVRCLYYYADAAQW